MSIRIVINGNPVMLDTEKKSYKDMREALATIGKTQNIAAKTVQESLPTVKALGDVFAAKPETDTVEIYEKPETKGATESLIVKGKVQKLGRRILAALNVESYAMDFVAKSESTKNDNPNAEKATDFDY